MSLEDVDSDFLSDESDCEAKENLSDSENDHSDAASYQELVHLVHNNLMCFDHIYINNVLTDMQYEEEEAWSDFDDDSVGSVCALMQDYIDSFSEEHMLPTNYYESYSVSVPEDGSDWDSGDSVLSSSHCSVGLYEEEILTSSPCSSAASQDTGGQMPNADDTNS